MPSPEVNNNSGTSTSPAGHDEQNSEIRATNQDESELGQVEKKAQKLSLVVSSHQSNSNENNCHPKEGDINSKVCQPQYEETTQSTTVLQELSSLNKTSVQQLLTPGKSAKKQSRFESRSKHLADIPLSPSDPPLTSNTTASTSSSQWKIIPRQFNYTNPSASSSSSLRLVGQHWDNTYQERKARRQNHHRSPYHYNYYNNRQYQTIDDPRGENEEGNTEQQKQQDGSFSQPLYYKPRQHNNFERMQSTSNSYDQEEPYYARKYDRYNEDDHYQPHKTFIHQSRLSLPWQRTNGYNGYENISDPMRPVANYNLQQEKKHQQAEISNNKKLYKDIAYDTEQRPPPLDTQESPSYSFSSFMPCYADSNKKNPCNNSNQLPHDKSRRTEGTSGSHRYLNRSSSGSMSGDTDLKSDTHMLKKRHRSIITFNNNNNSPRDQVNTLNITQELQQQSLNFISVSTELNKPKSFEKQEEKDEKTNLCTSDQPLFMLDDDSKSRQPQNEAFHQSGDEPYFEKKKFFTDTRLESIGNHEFDRDVPCAKYKKEQQFINEQDIDTKQHFTFPQHDHNSNDFCSASVPNKESRWDDSPNQYTTDCYYSPKCAYKSNTYNEQKEFEDYSYKNDRGQSPSPSRLYREERYQYANIHNGNTEYRKSWEPLYDDRRSNSYFHRRQRPQEMSCSPKYDNSQQSLLEGNNAYNNENSNSSQPNFNCHYAKRHPSWNRTYSSNNRQKVDYNPNSDPHYYSPPLKSNNNLCRPHTNKRTGFHPPSSDVELTEQYNYNEEPEWILFEDDYLRHNNSCHPEAGYSSRQPVINSGNEEMNNRRGSANYTTQYNSKISEDHRGNNWFGSSSASGYNHYYRPEYHPYENDHISFSPIEQHLPHRSIASHSSQFESPCRSRSIDDENIIFSRSSTNESYRPPLHCKGNDFHYENGHRSCDYGGWKNGDVSKYSEEPQPSSSMWNDAPSNSSNTAPQPPLVSNKKYQYNKWKDYKRRSLLWKQQRFEPSPHWKSQQRHEGAEPWEKEQEENVDLKSLVAKTPIPLMAHVDKGVTPIEDNSEKQRLTHANTDILSATSDNSKDVLKSVEQLTKHFRNDPKASQEISIGANLVSRKISKVLSEENIDKNFLKSNSLVKNLKSCKTVSSVAPVAGADTATISLKNEVSDNSNGAKILSSRSKEISEIESCEQETKVNVSENVESPLTGGSHRELMRGEFIESADTNDSPVVEHISQHFPNEERINRESLVSVSPSNNYVPSSAANKNPFPCEIHLEHADSVGALSKSTTCLLHEKSEYLISENLANSNDSARRTITSSDSKRNLIDLTPNQLSPKALEATDTREANGNLELQLNSRLQNPTAAKQRALRVRLKRNVVESDSDDEAQDMPHVPSNSAIFESQGKKNGPGYSTQSELNVQVHRDGKRKMVLHEFNANSMTDLKKVCDSSEIETGETSCTHNVETVAPTATDGDNLIKCVDVARVKRRSLRILDSCSEDEDDMDVDSPEDNSNMEEDITLSTPPTGSVITEDGLRTSDSFLTTIETSFNNKCETEKLKIFDSSTKHVFVTDEIESAVTPKQHPSSLLQSPDRLTNEHLSSSTVENANINLENVVTSKDLSQDCIERTDNSSHWWRKDSITLPGEPDVVIPKKRSATTTTSSSVTTSDIKIPLKPKKTQDMCQKNRAVVSAAKNRKLASFDGSMKREITQTGKNATSPSTLPTRSRATKELKSTEVTSSRKKSMHADLPIGSDSNSLKTKKSVFLATSPHADSGVNQEKLSKRLANFSEVSQHSPEGDDTLSLTATVSPKIPVPRNTLIHRTSMTDVPKHKTFVHEKSNSYNSTGLLEEKKGENAEVIDHSSSLNKIFTDASKSNLTPEFLINEQHDFKSDPTEDIPIPHRRPSSATKRDNDAIDNVRTPESNLQASNKETPNTADTKTIIITPQAEDYNTMLHPKACNIITNNRIKPEDLSENYNQTASHATTSDGNVSDKIIIKHDLENTKRSSVTEEKEETNTVVSQNVSSSFITTEVDKQHSLNSSCKTQTANGNIPVELTSVKSKLSGKRDRFSHELCCLYEDLIESGASQFLLIENNQPSGNRHPPERRLRRSSVGNSSSTAAPTDSTTNELSADQKQQSIITLPSRSQSSIQQINKQQNSSTKMSVNKTTTLYDGNTNTSTHSKSKKKERTDKKLNTTGLVKGYRESRLVLSPLLVTADTTKTTSPCNNNDTNLKSTGLVLNANADDTLRQQRENLLDNNEIHHGGIPSPIDIINKSKLNTEDAENKQNYNNCILLSSTTENSMTENVNLLSTNTNNNVTKDIISSPVVGSLLEYGDAITTTPLQLCNHTMENLDIAEQPSKKDFILTETIPEEKTVSDKFINYNIEDTDNKSETFLNNADSLILEAATTLNNENDQPDDVHQEFPTLNLVENIIDSDNRTLSLDDFVLYDDKDNIAIPRRKNYTDNKIGLGNLEVSNQKPIKEGGHQTTRNKLNHGNSSLSPAVLPPSIDSSANKWELTSPLILSSSVISNPTENRMHSSLTRRNNNNNNIPSSSQTSPTTTLPKLLKSGNGRRRRCESAIVLPSHQLNETLDNNNPSSSDIFNDTNGIISNTFPIINKLDHNISHSSSSSCNSIKNVTKQLSTTQFQRIEDIDSFPQIHEIENNKTSNIVGKDLSPYDTPINRFQQQSNNVIEDITTVLIPHPDITTTTLISPTQMFDKIAAVETIEPTTYEDNKKHPQFKTSHNEYSEDDDFDMWDINKYELCVDEDYLSNRFLESVKIIDDPIKQFLPFLPIDIEKALMF